MLIRRGWVLAAVALFASCATDPEQRKSGRGESCETRRDCSDGLACIDGVCSERKFSVKTTNKQCHRIECREDDDCCPQPTAYCLDLEEQCELGSTTACTLYDGSCRCSARCDDGECVETCSDTDPCSSGACVDGECVECACDAHCGSGMLCVDARCALECERDTQCPPFHTCKDGACVETGCASDRECIEAHFGDLLYFCDDGACLRRCQSDIECDSSESYDFLACIDGACRNVGCETDVECRIYLGAGLRQDAACREGPPPSERTVPGVGGEECPGGGTGVCGDGVLDTGELCDGLALGGETCSTVSGGTFTGGTLGCTSACTYDVSLCTTSTGFCGDGIVNGAEECDGASLGGATCSSVTQGVLQYGVLRCVSCFFDVGRCSAQSCDSCQYAMDGFCDEGSFCAVGTDCSDCGDVCVNTCIYANNGVCNDPGLCAPGTDCNDCTPVPCENTCASAFNGVCDEPGLCAPGTDCDDCGAPACDDSCDWANDGFCDEPTLCPTGTDCTDCGGPDL